MKSRLLTAITLLLIAMMALPVLTSPAQADGDDPPVVMLEGYGGYIQYVGEDFIVVDGMVFYANGAFNPAELTEGDYVVIDAVMNEDGTFETSGLDVDDTQPPPEEPEPGDEITVVGEITITDDGIFVGDYEIAPAGTFIPSSLTSGDFVIITGLLLNEGTIQASSIFVVEDLDDDQSDECDADDDDDDGDDDDDDDCNTDDDDDDDDDDSGVCGNLNPVGETLASVYEESVSEEQIGEWRCDGYGYGEIARALALADLAGEDADEILARREDGEGWGNILKDYDIHPSELAPGRAISKGKNKNRDDDDEGLTSDGKGRGNGRGPKGNNGRGNPHNDD